MRGRKMMSELYEVISNNRWMGICKQRDTMIDQIEVILFFYLWRPSHLDHLGCNPFRMASEPVDRHG